MAAPDGAEYRIDRQHVPQRVFERHRHWTVREDRAGKQLALNRVLITYLDFLDAIVDENSRGGVVRGVYGHFDRDAASGTEQIDPLVALELRAAQKNTLAGWKLQHRGSQPIRPELGIVVHQPDGAQRLFTEREARQGDGVTADIEESAAAFPQVTNVRWIPVEIAEQHRNGAQFANFARSDRITSRARSH